MRSQVTLWHTFIYLWQRHHYTALSPHDPLTPITHYHKNNTTYFFSALLSTLIVSGCQNVTCQESDECTSHESPGPESLRLLYRCFWQEIKDVGLSINYWHWNRQPVGWEKRPMNEGARWVSGLVWGLSLSLFTKPTIPIVPLSPARCKDVRMSSQH